MAQQKGGGNIRSLEEHTVIKTGYILPDQPKTQNDDEIRSDKA